MSSQASMLKPVLWERLFERESAPNLSLQGRVRQMLVSAILSGHLPPGAPVPGWLLARIGLPRLMEARSVPVGANASSSS